MSRKTLTTDILRLITTLVLGITAISGSASAVTTATGEVSVVGDYKIYAYTVWNSEGIVELFEVGMPEEGARAVVEATSSAPGFHGSAELAGDASTCWWGGAGIGSGESVMFYVRTLASVPTSYSWTGPYIQSNWSVIVYPDEGGRGELRWGDSLLPVPVPVPEPSSLLALGLAASGLGAAVLRRKQR